MGSPDGLRGLITAAIGADGSEAGELRLTQRARERALAQRRFRPRGRFKSESCPTPFQAQAASDPRST
eukprot:8480166-Lingulodinium_polyedra.AAC.1